MPLHGDCCASYSSKQSDQPYEYAAPAGALILRCSSITAISSSLPATMQEEHSLPAQPKACKPGSSSSVKSRRAQKALEQVVQQRVQGGHTPLHFAVESGKIESMLLMLCLGAKMDAGEQTLDSLVQLALDHDQVEMAQALINTSKVGPALWRGAAVAAVACFGWMARHRCVMLCANQPAVSACQWLHSTAALVEGMLHIAKAIGAGCAFLTATC
jgi:hypothetical protein